MRRCHTRASARAGLRRSVVPSLLAILFLFAASACPSSAQSPKEEPAPPKSKIVPPAKSGEAIGATGIAIPRFNLSTVNPRVADIIRSGLTRRFYVYTFTRSGGRTTLDYRAWNGELLHRDAWDSGRRATFMLRDRRGRAIVSRSRQVVSGWYRASDRNLFKLFLNARNEPVGSMQLDSLGNRTVAIDLNGDGRLDFLAKLERSGRLQIFASEELGLQFYVDMLSGRPAQCDAASISPAVDASPRFNFRCNRRSGGGRPTGTGIGGSGPTGELPIDTICKGVPATATHSSPLSRTEDAESFAEGVLAGVVAAWVVANPEAALLLIGSVVLRPDPPHSSDRVELDAVVITAGEGDDEVDVSEESPAGGDVSKVYLEDIVINVPVPASTGDKSAKASDKSPKDSKSDKSDDKGAKGGDKGGKGGTKTPVVEDPNSGRKAWAAICQARRDQRARWGFLSVREATSCDNPYRMPVPAPPTPDDRGFPLPSERMACTDPNQPFVDIENLLRDAGSNCPPYAQPGPDGRCQGGTYLGPGSGSARGAAFVSFGSIIGVQPCDPKICNPAKQ